MSLKKNISILFLFISLIGYTQKPVFSHQDTLRGAITKERAWWDLKHYDLHIQVNIPNKSLKGSNTIRYKVLDENQVMQIDLQFPMKITSVKQDGSLLKYRRDGNAYFIILDKKQQLNHINQITIDYEGVPKVSKNPPWDDGLTWSKDKNGTDFIATSCQGGGASIWWPCKDHMYDEPEEGMIFSINAPENLTSVANGRLKKTVHNKDKTKTFMWEVVNPINNYGVNMNIGDYTHFSSVYEGLNGKLDCDYYVLSYNLEKATKQFKQADKTLEAFEYWFGPYPFYEDSYKLVEVPYLGMEHQSSVTYGNGYKNGYRGYDLSGTGWGLKFDFIIIHESGHEWFANSITNVDIADMWIHEGFTAYSENLYLDYHFGTEASNAYVVGTRKLVQNDKPIIGAYNVNNPGSSDMYYKGANMIHTLRQIVNDDNKWRSILKGLNTEFFHQTVTTKQIENYLSKHIGIDLQSFFDQYLRTRKIPVLEYTIKDGHLAYKWSNTVKNFKMPIKIYIAKQIHWLTPSDSLQKLSIKNPVTALKVDPNFYIDVKNLTEESK